MVQRQGGAAMNETERYKRAGEIARHAMGKDKRGDSEAISDPLAWWCLTEWIASVPTSGLSKKSGKPLKLAMP